MHGVSSQHFFIVIVFEQLHVVSGRINVIRRRKLLYGTLYNSEYDENCVSICNSSNDTDGELDSVHHADGERVADAVTNVDDICDGIHNAVAVAHTF